MLDKTKIDLNAPAFGSGAQKLADLTEKAPVGEPEQIVEPTEKVEDKQPVESEDETQVPYSRFKKFHDIARQSEEEIANLRNELELVKQAKFEKHEEVEEMPDYWTELYGDSEASQKAWKIQRQRELDIEKRAYEAGQRGARELSLKEAERVNTNLSEIDRNFEVLSDYLGRDLTQKEESAILDIVDEYTAKDEEGNYQGSLIPFDKAWDIYEMKNNTLTASRKQSRDEVALKTGTNSQGNADVNLEKDQNFNPFERRSWAKRL